MGKILNGIVCIFLILVMLFKDYPEGLTNDLVLHGFLAVMNLMFVVSY